MINLLPPEIKSSYRFARTNVLLRKWVVMFGLALVGLAAIATVGLLSIHQSTVDYQKKIADSQATFQKENFTGTQKRVEEISGSIKLAVTVLKQEVLFSKLIQQIAITIPNGASLAGLNINQAQSAIDITANADTYDTAAQVQVNLADPKNKIFTKADIISITCNSKADATVSATASQYPCTVNIRALFSKDNSFLFINSDSTKAKP